MRTPARTTKEPWKPLKLIGKETKNFGKKKIRFSDELDGASRPADLPLKYCLLPKQLIEEQTDDLKTLPAKSPQLSEKINRLLINCRAIPFGKLVALLASDVDDELIIKVLQKSAMLVQVRSIRFGQRP